MAGDRLQVKTLGQGLSQAECQGTVVRPSPGWLMMGTIADHPRRRFVIALPAILEFIRNPEGIADRDTEEGGFDGG